MPHRNRATAYAPTESTLVGEDELKSWKVSAPATAASVTLLLPSRTHKAFSPQMLNIWVNSTNISRTSTEY